MDIILNYLDSVFSRMPDTEETRRAKRELASMMEDKYAELKAEGKSENEAIGTVIAEFGNIEELMGALEPAEVPDAAALDAEKEPGGTTFDEKRQVRMVSAGEAREYLERMTRWSEKIAAGVFLCILSPAAPIIMDTLSPHGKLAELLGVVVLFCMVAAAVYLFIVNGMAMSKYDWLKKNAFVLEPGTERLLRQYQEENRLEFGKKIAAGVLLCILSVVPTIVLESFGEGGLMEMMGTLLFLTLVACGVFLFITAGIPYGCLGVLLQEGDYSPQRKKNDLTGRIASVYWSVVTAAYLLYSFLTNDWGRSWIIWPVAGVLFGAVAAVCHMAGPKEN